MERSRWREIEALWERATALEPAELDAFLERLAERDAALAEQLEELLRAAEDDAFLARPALGLAAETPDPWIGRRLGSYRLVERVGEGGMSWVYRAVQQGADFERDVAVKLLRGLAMPDLGARLVAERRILAALEHPNIARFLDGGTTDEGVPFVVLEYVRGVPITEHCRRAGLGTSEILGLFRRVCEAVQYAHARLVVHRDLKPANLLVTPEGDPKLLDFGLAKLLDAEGGAFGDPTETQYRALTPNYASPEQIAGRPVTTATDVYSLGVLLYELLTGERPFELAGRSPAEIQSTLESREPDPPSERLRSRALATGARRAAKGSAAARRTATLPTDLDRIVLKALRLEPERRYGSAQAFSADVGRFLDGLPVEARAQTIGYRTRKFVARHRAIVALAALLAISVLVFAVSSLRQASRLRAERNLALQEQRRAEAALTFIEEVFQLQDPHSEAATRVGRQELLDRQRRRLFDDFRRQPELQSRLAPTLGLLYQNQGLYEEARRLLEQSLEIAAGVYEPGHPRVAELRLRLGTVLLNIGEYDAAEEHLEAAISALDGGLPATRAALGRALSVYGQLRRERGDDEGAERALRRAIELLEPLDAEQLPSLLAYLASVRQRRGDLVEAESLARRALEASRERGEIRFAEASNGLGEMLRNATRYREAESHLRTALEIYRRRLGDDAQTGAVLNNLGLVLRARGDYRGALEAYEEAHEIFRQVYGEEHVFLAVNATNRGRLERILGRPERAEELLAEALRIYRRELGDDHPHVGLALKALAELRRDQARPREALDAAREAQRILAAHVDEDHPWRATTGLTEGSILIDLGRLDAARERLERSLSLLEQTPGAMTPHRAEAFAQLARLALAERRDADAARLYHRAASAWRKVDTEHPERGWALAGLARAHHRLGRREEAETARAEAIDILERRLPGHPRLNRVTEGDA